MINPISAWVTAALEVAASFDPGIVTDSGIVNAALESAVNDAIFDDVVNPVSPFSVIGWLVGLPL